MKTGWFRKFDEPIPLPIEALILVATHGGPTVFARIGIMQALNRHVSGARRGTDCR